MSSIWIFAEKLLLTNILVVIFFYQKIVTQVSSQNEIDINPTKFEYPIKFLFTITS